MGMATGPRAMRERPTTSTSKRFQPSDTKGLRSARATFGRCALTAALVCIDSKVQHVEEVPAVGHEGPAQCTRDVRATRIDQLARLYGKPAPCTRDTGE